MEKVTYAVTVKVAGGPTLPIAGTLEVDAYEKLDLAVAAHAGGTDGKATVTVAPGELADVLALIITSSSNDGTLRVQTSAAGAADISLTGPITLLGGAAVSLLGTKPDQLTFTNTATSEARVTILVARKAVA